MYLVQILVSVWASLKLSLNKNWDASEKLWKKLISGPWVIMCFVTVKDWFLQFAEMKWKQSVFQCFGWKLSSVIEKDNLQTVCHSRLLSATHCAYCVKGTDCRILISEQRKRAVVVFVLKLTTASLWLFLLDAQQKLKRKELLSIIWLVVQCEEAASGYLSVSQEIHSQNQFSAKYVHIQRINLEDMLTME